MRGARRAPRSSSSAATRPRCREFDLTTYKGELYPGEYRFKYPKAGEANSDVQLWIYDTRGGMMTQVPLGLESGEPYIPRFGWTNNDDVLWFMRMNRLQNEKLIYTVNAPLLRPVQKGLQAKEIYREKSDTYIEVTDDLHFMSDGSGFVIASEKSGWYHIYWCNMDGTVMRPITAGDYDVGAMKGVDETEQARDLHRLDEGPEPAGGLGDRAQRQGP